MTEEAKKMALEIFDNGFDSYEKREYAVEGSQTGTSEGQLYFFWPEDVDKLRKALQPAPMEDVPQEVVDLLKYIASEYDDAPGSAKRAEKALTLLNSAAKPQCKCDIRTKLVGDGCETCNPEYAAKFNDKPEIPDDVREAILQEGKK